MIYKRRQEDLEGCKKDAERDTEGTQETAGAGEVGGPREGDKEQLSVHPKYRIPFYILLLFVIQKTKIPKPRRKTPNAFITAALNVPECSNNNPPKTPPPLGPRGPATAALSGEESNILCSNTNNKYNLCLMRPFLLFLHRRLLLLVQLL